MCAGDFNASQQRGCHRSKAADQKEALKCSAGKLVVDPQRAARGTSDGLLVGGLTKLCAAVHITLDIFHGRDGNGFLCSGDSYLLETLVLQLWCLRDGITIALLLARATQHAGGARWYCGCLHARREVAFHIGGAR